MDLVVRDWLRNAPVVKFFNNIQVTCVGAHVDEFAINESDHALIYM